MELWVYGVIGLLSVTVLGLVWRIVALKLSVRKIANEFNDIIGEDTNTLISINASDKETKFLVKSINRELASLRDERRQLQNGDAELKKAVTNVTHDIRTPLTAISGYLQLLEREEKSEAVTKYISMIENRTYALHSLTEELFKYSVLTSKTELVLEKIDIGSVLEQCLASAYGTLTQRGITPEINITNKKAERLLDRSALCRIFENIISNAAKYSDGDLKVEMKDSGEIIFSNYARELDVIAVGRLFDRFYTVETGRKSTGLGLSIAKMLTERMNGKIKAEYKEERFYIIIDFSASALETVEYK